jgi:hypothetical protein
MPFCPECRAEYRKGFDRCPSCDVDLVEEADLSEMMTDEEVIASMAEEDLVPIRRGSIEGCREIQAKLLEQRIPAAIHEAQDEVSEAGHFRILQVVVRKDDAEQAVEVLEGDWVRDALQEGLLDDMESVRGKVAEDVDDGDAEPACPACGCTKPLKKGRCPDCGLHLA